MASHKFSYFLLLLYSPNIFLSHSSSIQPPSAHRSLKHLTLSQRSSMEAAAAMAQWWGLSVSRDTIAPACLLSTAWPTAPGLARFPLAPGSGATSSQRWVSDWASWSCWWLLLGCCCSSYLFLIIYHCFWNDCYIYLFIYFMCVYFLIRMHWSIKSYTCGCIWSTYSTHHHSPLPLLHRLPMGSWLICPGITTLGTRRESSVTEGTAWWALLPSSVAQSNNSSTCPHVKVISTYCLMFSISLLRCLHVKVISICT